METDHEQQMLVGTAVSILKMLYGDSVLQPLSQHPTVDLPETVKTATSALRGAEC